MLQAIKNGLGPVSLRPCQRDRFWTSPPALPTLCSGMLRNLPWEREVCSSPLRSTLWVRGRPAEGVGGDGSVSGDWNKYVVSRTDASF